MLPNLRNNFFRFTPPLFRVYGKKSLKIWRRICSRALNRTITKESLISDFFRQGIMKDDVVIVHSSLSKLGDVKDGATTVIEALLDSVGKAGTIVVPTFCSAKTGPGDYLKNSPPYFDARTTPSEVGKISEVFRNYPNAMRSCHPTHSVAAIGPHAEFIVSSHHAGETPFDRFSPFYKILELDGKWLFLCVDIDKFTIYHVFEDLCENFPFSIYYDDPLLVRVIDMNGEEKFVKSKLHRKDLASIRIDNEKSKIVINRVRKRFEEMNILKSGQTGIYLSYLIRAKEGLDALFTLLDQGETIYLSQKEQKKLRIFR
jgi:aminoglycoside 3-N-acetyltransferase